jgi:hypothetical protein
LIDEIIENYDDITIKPPEYYEVCTFKDNEKYKEIEIMIPENLNDKKILAKYFNVKSKDKTKGLQGRKINKQLEVEVMKPTEVEDVNVEDKEYIKYDKEKDILRESDDSYNRALDTIDSLYKDFEGLNTFMRHLLNRFEVQFNYYLI